MKKISIFLMLAAFLMPLAMNAQTRNDVPEGFAKITLTAGDVWEDGSGYQMLLDADATAFGNIIPETGGLTTSGDASDGVYAEFEYKIPENADGSCSSENIVINNSISILIPAGVYDWCITNPTPGERIWIASENGNVGGRADDYEFLSGVAYEFTVTLGGQNDQVDVTIDDPTAPVIPTDVAVTPTMTTGKVEWVAGENNATWNLRWRPWTDPASLSQLWDFPLDGYEEQTEGWSLNDADGDGYNWGLTYSSNDQDDVCFYSASWSRDAGALSPDNWLITPEVALGGTLKFKTWNVSSSYPDKIMVYVCNKPDFESLDDFVAISDFIQPSTSPEEREIDLSAYEGTGFIAFRHYDCSDQYMIYLDDIEVIPANPAELQEWTVVESLTNPAYTIEDLTPETQYEVQVMAFDESGEKNTDWTTSVIFTTLGTVLELVDGEDNLEIIEEYADNGFTGDVKITGRTLYKDGCWNTLCLPFAISDITGTPLEGATVKALEDAQFDSGTLTLFFSTNDLIALEAGVPYIVKWAASDENITDPVFNNVTIESADIDKVGNDIINFVGTYAPISWEDEDPTVLIMGSNNKLNYPSPSGDAVPSVNAFRAYFQLSGNYAIATEGSSSAEGAKIVQVLLNFGDGQGIATGIVSLDASQGNGNIYTLSGLKLDKAPKQKGVYIQNGRKVVVSKR